MPEAPSGDDPSREATDSLASIFGKYTPAPSLKAQATETGEISRAKHWPYISSIIPATIDYDHFGMRPLFLGVLLGSFKVNTQEKVLALAGTYDLTKQYLAPFMVKTAIDMIPNLVAATRQNPRARIVFVGRDAFSIGYIVRNLFPQFYEQSCRALYLSRAIVDAALRELEETEGKSFASIEKFRKRPSIATSPGPAWQALTRYFKEKDIHLDREGMEVHLVDTAYKGSVQVMLSAAYPRTRFYGHYVFFGASPYDPHPENKKGYALHLDTEHSSGGLALRGTLPEDPGLTFAHHEAIIVVEELLQGSHLSPTALCPDGKPLEIRYRHTPRPIDGLNPALIAEEYTDPFLREGVLSLNVIAVSQYASKLAPRVTASGDTWYETASTTEWYAELAEHAESFRTKVRTWVGRRDIDPALARCLDAFIHRVDKGLIVQMAADLEDAGLPDDEQRAIWQALDRRAAIEDKKRFLELSLDDMRATALHEADQDKPDEGEPRPEP